MGSKVELSAKYRNKVEWMEAPTTPQCTFFTTHHFLLYIQLLPSVLVLLPGFTGGAAISYGAVALPHYMDPDNDSGLVMTEEQATWFGEISS